MRYIFAKPVIPIVLLVVISAVTSTAKAASIGFTAGTLGSGAEVSFSISEKFNLRLGASALEESFTITNISNIDMEMDATLEIEQIDMVKLFSTTQLRGFL